MKIGSSNLFTISKDQVDVDYIFMMKFCLTYSILNFYRRFLNTFLYFIVYTYTSLFISKMVNEGTVSENNKHSSEKLCNPVPDRFELCCISRL